MNTTSTVQFMGGPLDGKTQTLPEDPPRNRLLVLLPPANLRGGARGREHEPIVPVPFVYKLEVSQLSEGPLWVYVPEVTEGPTT